ncbi:hypothetical protein [Brachybacterium sp.]
MTPPTAVPQTPWTTRAERPGDAVALRSLAPGRPVPCGRIAYPAAFGG